MSIRPSDYHYWEQKIRRDPKYKTAMATKAKDLLELEVRSVTQKDNNKFFFYGTPNSGKSEGALAIALTELEYKAELLGNLVDTLLIETEYGLAYSIITDNGSVTLHVTFNLDQTSKILEQKTVKKGDIILQDEFPHTVGELSATIKKQIDNVLGVCRVTLVSFYFVCPFVVNIAVINAYLETIAKYVDKRVTSFMMYDKERDPMGVVFVELHNIPELRELYEKKKEENAFGLLGKAGQQQVRQTIEEDALKVIAKMKEEGYHSRKLADIELVAKEMGIQTAVKYHKDVARKARLLLSKEEGPPVDKVEEYKGQTANLRQAVLEQLSKYANKRDVKIFAEWIDGELQRDISDRYDITQSMVSEAIGRIRQKHLGYAFEDVYYKTLDDGWSHGGKNTDEPDFLNEGEKKVISAKCYADKAKTITIPVTELGKKELALKDEGWGLGLVFYNVCWDRVFTISVGDQKRFTFSRQP